MRSTRSRIGRSRSMLMRLLGISLVVVAVQGFAQETVSIPIPETQQRIQADLYVGAKDTGKRGIVLAHGGRFDRRAGGSRRRFWLIEVSSFWPSHSAETGRILTDHPARSVPRRTMQPMYWPQLTICTAEEFSGSQRSEAASAGMQWETQMRDPRQERSTASCS